MTSRKIYHDYNKNNFLDTNELGFSHIPIVICNSYDCNSSTDDFKTVTNSNGDFKFQNLSSTSFTIQLIIPEGYYNTGNFEDSTTINQYEMTKNKPVYFGLDKISKSSFSGKTFLIKMEMENKTRAKDHFLI